MSIALVALGSARRMPSPRTAPPQQRPVIALLVGGAETPVPIPPPVRRGRRRPARKPPAIAGTSVAAASSRIAAALAERLADTRLASLAPRGDVDAALRALGGRRLDSGSAAEVARAVGAQAVVTVTATNVAVADGAQRVMRVRATARTLWTSPGTAVLRGPDEVDVSSAVRAGRSLITHAYDATPDAMLDTVSARIAGTVVHVWSGGAQEPLTAPGDRVVLAPLRVPEEAGSISFSAAGQAVSTVGLNLAGPEVADAYALDTDPLAPTDVVSPRAAVRAARAAGGVFSSAGAADARTAVALGTSLRCTYVLAASVTRVDIYSGPPEPVGGLFAADAAESVRPLDAAPSGPHPGDIERDADAEAAGVLIRVSDGRILWQDRARARLRVPPRGAAPAIPDSEMARDAARFALNHLCGLFRAWRASFEH